jgi:hypothetical protein
MKKIVRDGKVAVLYSPDYGAGWSTWNTELATEFMFESTVVQFIEMEADDYTIQAYMKDTYGENACIMGLSTLAICWIPVGTKFRIDEYDGFESVKAYSEDDWTIA